MRLLKKLFIIYHPQMKLKRADLKRVMGAYFLYEKPEFDMQKPFVELILGVNGAGKTTSIAKLANLYKKQGQKVILGACDTFRAGAIEQLRLWAEKIGVQIVLSNQGHDPSAVAFDTISKAKARDFDRVILDTAGRLQNQKNLAKRTRKNRKNLRKKLMINAPHRKFPPRLMAHKVMRGFYKLKPLMSLLGLME